MPSTAGVSREEVRGAYASSTRARPHASRRTGLRRDPGLRRWTTGGRLLQRRPAVGRWRCFRLAFVILADPPLAAWPGAVRTANGKLNFSSGTNGRYQAALARARNDFKQWLRASGSPARVVREYDTVLQGVAVELNGASLDSLRAGPGVTVVEPSGVYAPLMNRTGALINVAPLWNALGGVGSAGAGMKVGVIDTGIDQTHPFLTDPTLVAPPGFPKADPGNLAFTNNKVIVARVYFTGIPGTFTAQALQDHGTHVSGTIAGTFGTSAPLASGLSGVAPKAFLGNYNVFPGTQGTASSHDIAQAIEDAVKDGMDVINMSLGGGIAGLQDQLTVATDRAVQAGVVAAVAAGNAGPGRNTVGSPAQAERAITVGASTNDRFFGITVQVVGDGSFPAAVGQFNPYVPAVTAPLANWNNTAAGETNDPNNLLFTGATRACTAITAGTHTGQIAVIDRGTCTFSMKIRNAQNAGAAGVLVVNSVAGDPFAMAQDGEPDQPTVPAAMLRLSDRGAIRTAATANQTAFVDGSVITANASTPNVLAGFSSRGPSNLLDLKPDVVAPGVNVYSSVLQGGFASFQGTSMATPHVAGVAALLRQLRPGWTPAQVKSAIVNSASRPSALGTSNPTNRGGGLVNAGAAGAVTATLDPAVLSFRKIEPTSGRSKSVDVSITNTTSSSKTYAISVSFPVAGFPSIPPVPPSASGVTITSSATSLTLGSGASSTFTVTVDTSHDSPSGQYWGDLVVTSGSSTLRAPFWFIIRTWVDAGPLI